MRISLACFLLTLGWYNISKMECEYDHLFGLGDNVQVVLYYVSGTRAF